MSQYTDDTDILGSGIQKIVVENETTKYYVEFKNAPEKYYPKFETSEKYYLKFKDTPENETTEYYPRFKNTPDTEKVNPDNKVIYDGGSIDGSD